MVIDVIPGFKSVFVNECTPESRKSFAAIRMFTAQMATAEEVAAPVMPKGGIKERFRTRFKIALNKAAHISTLTLPIAIKVAPFGPKKV